MCKFRYRFSIGDSNESGPVGVAFDFIMEQKKMDRRAALRACKKQLAEYGAKSALTGLQPLSDPFADFCIYINEGNLTLDDIADVTEIDES